MCVIHKILARESYHPIVTYPLFLLRVLVCRFRYARQVKRIHGKAASGEKIKVAFLSMDISKWKCQTVYDALVADGRFDPYVALTMTEEDETHAEQDIRERNGRSRAYYEGLGCRVVEACDPRLRKVASGAELGADLVFYQVPWGNLQGQTVWEMSKYALTCYMPYGIDCVEWKSKSRRFDFHHMADFHCLLWVIFQWSEHYAEYAHAAQFSWEWAGRMIGLGHSSLDCYGDLQKQFAGKDDFVVYAPHFSFTWNGLAPIMNFSTFHWSGRPVLEYAKRHPEIKWLFKPHPKLREYVVNVGFMTKEEVRAYYSEWERIGVGCYDGDYARLFVQSRAMITDCGSFLMEYMATGKPLIRLIPADIKVEPCPAAKEIFESFYNCYALDDMERLFGQVLERREDPQCDRRHAACRKANLLGNNAAKNIVCYLLEELNA